jgi:hypothetical protein
MKNGVLGGVKPCVSFYNPGLGGMLSLFHKGDKDR